MRELTQAEMAIVSGAGGINLDPITIRGGGGSDGGNGGGGSGGGGGRGDLGNRSETTGNGEKSMKVVGDLVIIKIMDKDGTHFEVQKSRSVVWHGKDEQGLIGILKNFGIKIGGSGDIGFGPGGGGNSGGPGTHGR